MGACAKWADAGRDVLEEGGGDREQQRGRGVKPGSRHPFHSDAIADEGGSSDEEP